MNADQAAWEENRLLTSGVATRNEIDTDFDDENEARVRIWVHKVSLLLPSLALFGDDV